MRSISKIFNLKNKVVLITGGAGLLGLEHADVLTDNGAIVYLADIDFEKIHAIKAKNNLHKIKLDVSKKDQWVNVVNKIINKHNSIDILINNAAFTNNSKSSSFDSSFENTPLEDWNKMLEVNLTGTFLGCQVVIPQMLKQGKGSIINISSLYGVVAPNHKIYPDTGIFQPISYSVSKHGVVALTKYLATMYAEKGIKINCISPGGVFNNQKEVFINKYNHLSPIGRMANKDEISGAILYLCSDASSNVIGHNLVVDGGWSLW